MTLKILGSSSAGNGYILETDNEVLLIEAGVKLKYVKQALGFDMSKIKGCIISHPSHGDHGGCVKDYLAAGINCYAGALEWNAINVSHFRAYPVHEYQLLNIGGFEIMPFSIQHDTPQPLGYLIKHPEIGTTLFLTDSYYTKHKFTGLTNIIVECNYSNEILNANLGNSIEPWRRNRLLSSHMSLDTLKEMLLANDLSKVNSIMLIHLSSANSDAALFKSEIEKVTGIQTMIADSGMVIEGYGQKTLF